MIVAEDFGFTLRCTGCRAAISLTMNEVRNLDRTLDIKSLMKRAHSECDGFRDVKKARAAIEAKRREARRAACGG